MKNVVVSDVSVIKEYNQGNAKVKKALVRLFGENMFKTKGIGSMVTVTDGSWSVDSNGKYRYGIDLKLLPLKIVAFGNFDTPDDAPSPTHNNCAVLDINTHDLIYINSEYLKVI